MLLLLPPALLIRTRGHGSFLRAAYILALLFLIVMSGSRTAWIALAGFLPLYWLIPVFSRLRRKDQFSSLLVLSGFLALGAFLVYYNFGDITRGLGKDPTLTGRTTNWLPMVHAILKRPLLGYGFGAFWLGSKGESLNIFLETGMILAQGHNAYVDLLLDLGLVGLVAFLITGVSAIRNALRSLRSDHVDSVKLYLSWLLIMLPLSITQGQFLYENDLFLIVYFVTCIGLYKGGGGGAEGRGSGKLTGVKPRTV
jgi:O-antigen ligase